MCAENVAGGFQEDGRGGGGGRGRGAPPTDPGGKREALGMCAFGEQGPRGHGNLMVGALLFSNKPVRPTREEPS